MTAVIASIDDTSKVILIKTNHGMFQTDRFMIRSARQKLLDALREHAGKPCILTYRPRSRGYHLLRAVTDPQG